MNNEYNNETEIDLAELVRVLWSKVWVLILTTALGIGIATGVTMLFMKPVYQSTSIMYVLNKSKEITSLSDFQIGTQITKDYMVVITSRPVLEKVIDDLGLDMSYDTLRSTISVNNPTDTRFLEITVSNHDAYLAKKIVDKLADESADSMAEVMETQKPNIMDYGQIATAPSSPSVKKNAIIGGLLGFVIAAAIIIILHLMNDSIRTSDDVEKYLGINTLGLIPLEEGVSKRRTRGRDATEKKKHKKHKHKDSGNSAA